MVRSQANSRLRPSILTDPSVESGSGRMSNAKARAAMAPASRTAVNSSVMVATAAAPSRLGRTILTGVVSYAWARVSAWMISPQLHQHRRCCFRVFLLMEGQRGFNLRQSRPPARVVWAFACAGVVGAVRAAGASGDQRSFRRRIGPRSAAACHQRQYRLRRRRRRSGLGRALSGTSWPWPCIRFLRSFTTIA